MKENALSDDIEMTIVVIVERSGGRSEAKKCEKQLVQKNDVRRRIEQQNRTDFAGCERVWSNVHKQLAILIERIGVSAPQTQKRQRIQSAK